jgi:hypothetical protein
MGCQNVQAKRPGGPPSHQSEATNVDLYEKASKEFPWKHDPDPTIELFFSILCGQLCMVDRESPENPRSGERGIPPVNVFTALHNDDLDRIATDQ